MADKKKKKKKNTEALHTGLDLLGLAPGPIGMFADGLNAGIYFSEGDVKNALVSGASAIPVYGNVSKAGGKLAKAADKVTDAIKGIKKIDQVKDTGKNAAKAADAARDAVKAADAARDAVKAAKTVKKSLKKVKLSKQSEKKLKAALKLKRAKKGKMRTGAKKAANRNNRKKTTQAQKNKNKKKQLKGKCFTADMLILTGRGYRQIKEIRKGDDIYSRNAKTGMTGLRKVAGVFQEEAHTIHHIWLDGKEELKMTAYHPVYVKDRGWVKAIQLRQGDLLETMDGTSQVTKVEKTRHEEPVEVYNFQVEEWESYFVSKMRVYVHNGEGDCGSTKKNVANSEVWDMKEGGGVINGREYSEHAMERMAPDTPAVRAELSRRAQKKAKQLGLKEGSREYYDFCNKYVDPRNIPPSVVEDAISSTKATAGSREGTFVHETEDVRVVINSIGKVVTVIPK